MGHRRSLVAPVAEEGAALWSARTPSPVGRRNAPAPQTPPRAPRRLGLGPGLESLASKAKAPLSPRTPSPEGRRAAPQTPPRPHGRPGLGLQNITPEARAQLATPPSCPGRRRVALASEIDGAFRERCVPRLKLVLQRGHCCAGMHPISEAVRRGHSGALELLLEAGSEGIDETCGGQRPLQRACDMCMCEGDAGYRMAEVLLRHGADLACRGAPHGDPPLHEASTRGSVAVVRLLLQHGADPCAPSPSGRSPLHAACQGAASNASSLHLRTVDLLLLRGGRPLAADAFGLPPRAYAADGGLCRKLSRAERWWTEQSLRSVCRATAARPGFAPPDRGPERLLHGLVTMSEVLEAVLIMVCGVAA